ncbi:MAG TPA: ABC transporter substrate-binding protein [Caulobacteraceae bacterium]|nr:ABC transporter substrate-binding protein [Caulobacteraceae bacterium]
MSRGLVATAIALGAIGVGSALSPSRAFAQASRDLQAEQFVGVQAQRIIAILSDQSQSRADKIAAFRAIIDQDADVPRITTFVLGKYARTITPDQEQRFAAVFRRYAQNVYESRMSEFHGETVKVTGSLVRKPGDVIVSTVIVGGALKQPLPVAWRVFGDGDSWKVVDVEVAGIWLAITQQQDFVATIDNHGGDIDALTAQLQQRTQPKKSATAP